MEKFSSIQMPKFNVAVENGLGQLSEIVALQSNRRVAVRCAVRFLGPGRPFSSGRTRFFFSNLECAQADETQTEQTDTSSTVPPFNFVASGRTHLRASNNIRIAATESLRTPNAQKS